MTLCSFVSVKFCQIASYNSLAFWPQASVNSWLSRAASSCGYQEDRKGDPAHRLEEGRKTKSFQTCSPAEIPNQETGSLRKQCPSS
jgi:hypothetical protein